MEQVQVKFWLHVNNKELISDKTAWKKVLADVLLAFQELIEG